jgi:hypothetical protein
VTMTVVMTTRVIVVRAIPILTADSIFASACLLSSHSKKANKIAVSYLHGIIDNLIVDERHHC